MAVPHCIIQWQKMNAILLIVPPGFAIVTFFSAFGSSPFGQDQLVTRKMIGRGKDEMGKGSWEGGACKLQPDKTRKV